MFCFFALFSLMACEVARILPQRDKYRWPELVCLYEFQRFFMSRGVNIDCIVWMLLMRGRSRRIFR